MLTTISATPEYWKHFYCALQSSKVVEKFVIEKFEDPQFTNENGIGPVPDTLGTNSSTFFQRCIQNCNGYMGWRFICTADESHTRSTINLVISEEFFEFIYDGQEEFEGNYDFYFYIGLNFFVLIMVSWSQDMMACLNLALEKFMKSPLLQMSTY
jgi:hypothetical protein